MIGAYGSGHSKDSSEYRLQKHMSGESMLPVANLMSEKRSKGRISLNASQNAADERETDKQRRGSNSVAARDSSQNENTRSNTRL